MDKQQFECFTLSPLDGRYAGIKDALGEYFSEYALVKYRVFVEIQWLKFLIENVESDVLSTFDKDNLGQIEAISKDFNYRIINNIHNRIFIHLQTIIQSKY